LWQATNVRKQDTQDTRDEPLKHRLVNKKRGDKKLHVHFHLEAVHFTISKKDGAFVVPSGKELRHAFENKRMSKIVQKKYKMQAEQTRRLDAHFSSSFLSPNVPCPRA
jgi:hypothetical protein